MTRTSAAPAGIVDALTIGSLFAGIGGLELGLERAGLGPVLWQAESDPFCRDVLARHWPDVHRYHDVREISGGDGERPDLICGGFPCQDLSVAGRGAGIDGPRSGLWREFARIVDAFRPALVVVENVTHGQRRWLPTVCGDLAELGYVPTAVTIPAGAVGAPHVRARTFVVADTDGQFLRLVEQRDAARPPERVRDEGEAEPLDDGRIGDAALAPHWSAAPRVDRVGDGIPGRLDDARYRTDRLRVLGNAVVPQVAEALGRAIVASRHPLTP